MDTQKKMLIKVVPDKVATKEDFEVTRSGNLSREGAKSLAKDVFADHFGKDYDCEFDFGDLNDTANDDQKIWVVSCCDITD